MSKALMPALIERFRYKILDLDPLENLLKGELEFSDDRVEHFIIEAWYQINETPPVTKFPINKFPNTSLLLDGAMLHMLKGRGLLHLRNQVSYSDAGFSVNVDDKSGFYAQWLGQLAGEFSQNLHKFKASQIPRFRGVNSPYRTWL